MRKTRTDVLSDAEHLPLRNGEVHLWHVFLDDLPDDKKMLDEYLALLTEQEREKSRCFLFDRDRLRYIATRVLVRESLSRYLEVAPHEWRFCENGYGRPRIEEPEMYVGKADFNLSHTDDLIIMAVSRDIAAGIDVENTTRPVDIDSLADCFMPFETAGLSRLAPDMKRQRFFELWTLKESYVKARSRGLSLPLDGFGFVLTRQGKIFPVFTDENHSEFSGSWRFIAFNPSPQHQASLCVSGETLLLRAFRCVPLLRAVSHPLWLQSFSARPGSQTLVKQDKRSS